MLVREVGFLKGEVEVDFWLLEEVVVFLGFFDVLFVSGEGSSGRVRFYCFVMLFLYVLCVLFI